ncbi:MAG: PIG-L deacetylase family protein [Cumulibacter sp.]
MSRPNFPDDWTRATVIVAHPDDPEYGVAAAICRWTDRGKAVTYVMASSGEAGIEGMPPAQAGPLREQEQIRSAAVVGVNDVQFLGFPDSALRNTGELRAAIAQVIA